MNTVEQRTLCPGALASACWSAAWTEATRAMSFAVSDAQRFVAAPFGCPTVGPAASSLRSGSVFPATATRERECHQGDEHGRPDHARAIRG